MADDDRAPGVGMVTLILIFLITADIRTVRGLDFMTHVEEKLMASGDTEVQRETIREMEEVFAYGEKSSFR